MSSPTRRRFLTDVGCGALAVSLGPTLAADLGLAPAATAAPAEPLNFGELEPLVALLQETPADKMLPLVTERLRGGTDLRTMVAAASLANARTFGGEDYVGFHTLMALPASYQMARALPGAKQPLPVLKVLYRNATRIKEVGGREKEVLKAVTPGPGPAGSEAVRELVRKRDLAGAERTFAAVARTGPDDALDAVLPVVEDQTDVHRVVLASRAWELVNFVGREHAEALLRQSVHYCVKNEEHSAKYGAGLRALLPRLFDQYKLAGRTPGKRPADDAWIESFCRTVYTSTADDAAGAAAQALAEGFDPEAVGVAIALAANRLVLCDPGRPEKWASANKPKGSVHGDSVGVHASDSVHAWRALARSARPRHTFACLILAAYHVAQDRSHMGGEFLTREPCPGPAAREKLTARDPAALLKLADAAIRANDQEGACAAVARYGTLGQSEKSVIDLLLAHSIRADGALHAEKYFSTTTDEFAAARPAFRWRHLVGLARVAASEHGYAAPGLAEAERLLGSG
jgi:hypothetical protein